MTNVNPFNFINPQYLKFPANKIMICPVEEEEHIETFFNGSHKKPMQRWSYDNYFFRDLPFEPQQRRGDRTNIEARMKAIHVEEQKKKVPSCTQSWYGHRSPKYNQQVMDCARTYEIDKVYRLSGMPWPKKDREQAFSSLDILKPSEQ